MDYSDLDLVDGNGDEFFVRVYADGTISSDWYKEYRAEVRREWDHDWWDDEVTGHLIPIIKAAFAALKENNNGPVHPCPAP